MYMDDIKIFARNEKEIEILMKIYNQNIGMEFGIDKCCVLVSEHK